MSYVLINGKRHYKDEQTGRIILDNVSQAEADQRAQRNQCRVRTARTAEVKHSTRTTGGSRDSRTASGTVRTTASTTRVNSSKARTAAHTGFSWKVIMVCGVIALFIGAFFYNYFHVSAEEQAITNYMNAQQENAVTDTGAYLIPDSATRYLETRDIENRSQDEIQMIINEIYARHGREFQSQDNYDYFSAQDWYEPIAGKSDEEIVSEFNEFEKANVELLREYL